MSKFNKQNRLDEKAISILSDYFMNKHGGRFDLQFHGIKDNTPDTDGFLRLRQPSNEKHTDGDYLNNVVFFQLKGTSKSVKNDSYKCSRKLIDFCKEINLPTILFVVSDIKEDADGQTDARIYWYHFSNVNVEILNKKNKGQGDVTIPNLSPLKINKSDFVEQFYLHVKNLAKKNQFLDLPKEILDIAIDLKDKILLVGSIVYLVGKVTKNEQKNIAKMIGVTNRQLEDILTSLSKQNLVYKSKDVYIFKQTTDEVKREVGLSLVYEVINKIDLEKMMELFTEHNQKQQIFSNLASVRHPIVFDFFKAESANLLKYVKK